MRALNPVLGWCATICCLAASCGPESYIDVLRGDAAVDAATGDTPTGDAATSDTATRDAGPRPDVGGCDTSFAGDVLYAFDTANAVFTGPAPSPTGTLPPGWFPYAEPGGSAALMQSTTEWVTTEGHTCPGALKLTANFTVYGVSEKVMALINFHANWSSPKAYSHLHGWVKIPLPSTGNLDHLSGIQFSTNSGNYTAFLGYNAPAGDLANNAWHPVDLALTPAANYVPGDVDQIGVQLIAKGSPPAGSAAPVPTSILIDDIWLE